MFSVPEAIIYRPTVVAVGPTRLFMVNLNLVFVLILFQIEGDIGLSDNGELTTEMQQILTKALEKVDDAYYPELK